MNWTSYVAYQQPFLLHSGLTCPYIFILFLLFFIFIFRPVAAGIHLLHLHLLRAFGVCRFRSGLLPLSAAVEVIVFFFHDFGWCCGACGEMNVQYVAVANHQSDPSSLDQRVPGRRARARATLMYAYCSARLRLKLRAGSVTSGGKQLGRAASASSFTRKLALAQSRTRTRRQTYTYLLWYLPALVIINFISGSNNQHGFRQEQLAEH